MKKSIFTGVVALTLVLSGCGAKMDHSNMNHEGNNTAIPQAGEMSHGENHGGGDTTAKDDNLKVTWKLTAEKPQSNQNDDLTIQVQDKDGKPVQDFEIQHEKLMHLIIVSKDLSYFEHIHPEYKGNGLFTITTKFPNGGDYKLYADFVPKGGEKSVKEHVVTVEGAAPHVAALNPDTDKPKAIENKEVTLSFDKLKAGEELTINFNIKNETTKQPISNLQPYLGAVGHVVIISEDTGLYLHVHPMDEKATGPDAKFMTTFPKSGTYKIWGQFQHEGKVFTVPFTVKVP
ncbi:hypothetical protein [Paenibacillus sedimenti]|uniref:Secreted protein n=1 Tax=Paenibacillus sedimenti TaxID=2770274 RepID=A0A926KS91_9BACL|nr:hypothetical protein [Paenibacillus sedimenti]MBD0383162.1 hypothetical protein [Paenibacillus sedimenti]